MPTLLWKDVGLVKGVAFNSDRRVGSLLPSIKVYCTRDVDELILLDISATRNNLPPDFNTIKSISEEVSVPFTVGGGITKTEDIRNLLLAGADKVAINTASYQRPNLVSQSAEMFGSQCIVASIDYRYEAGKAVCYSHSGTKSEHISVLDWVKTMEQEGAGEVLLTSIERDGTMTGFDCKLIERVANSISIPVIASGGAGCAEDFLNVITGSKASAAAAASIFHFTEQTPLQIKEYLDDKGVNIRK